MMMNNEPIEALKGIGQKKKLLYNKLGIYTTEDLINYFPVTYRDYRKPKKISNLKEGEEVLIKGKIVFVAKNNNSNLRLTIDDTSGRLGVVFFNSKYLSTIMKKGLTFMFYGKVSTYKNNLHIVNPEYIPLSEFEMGIYPIYRLTKGLSQNEIKKRIKELLKKEFDEYLPKNLIDNNRMCPIGYMYKGIHMPRSLEELKVAKYRNIYENILIMQIGIKLMKNDENNGISMKENIDAFLKNLPFSLTKDQEKAIIEIDNNMTSGKKMNRLLQGDVGSGKTVVACASLYKGVVNGYQGVLMAPTEILAKQHYITLKKYFEPYGFKIALLSGSISEKEKKEIQVKIESGEYDIIIGTHAVISEKVNYKKLGIVVTDEQHRFGVNQRMKLMKKGECPHILVMTATPIPRTLAVIFYGDLDISIIKSLPKGRKPIITYKIEEYERERLYIELKEKILQGRQGYIVTPLITESENLENIKSVEEVYAELKEKYKKESIKIEMLHGDMKQAEKDKIMNGFAQGEIDLLISTVVIEVGIDVPNATFMVIENAERFGLAQLHQLRGRVGRGTQQSYCYLINKSNGDIAKKRAEIMCKSTDGFYISEKDLELRGPGEVFGFRQHGLPDQCMIEAIKHIDILEKVKKDIEMYDLTNEIIMKKTENLYGKDFEISL